MNSIKYLAAGSLLIGLLATQPANIHAEMYPTLVETPITLEALQFLPADIMEGANYRIEQSVSNDGRISMSNMCHIVNVINRGSNI